MNRTTAFVIVKLVVFTMLWIPCAARAESVSSIPKFRSYPVEVYRGPVSAPNLSSHSRANKYRTRLRNAAKGRVNFAGHYILTSWGCGTTCVTGAVLDARNGDVFFLPFSVCCWGNVDDGFRPIEFRKDSTLLVVAGLRNEQGTMGAHFYNFQSGEFVHLQTIETDEHFGNGDQSEEYGSTPIANDSADLALQNSRDCMLTAVPLLDDKVSPASDIAKAVVIACSDQLKKYAALSARQHRLTVLRITELAKEAAYESALVMVLQYRGERKIRQ